MHEGFVKLCACTLMAMWRWGHIIIMCNYYYRMASTLGAEVKSMDRKDNKIQHCAIEVNGAVVYIADSSTCPSLQPMATSGKVQNLMLHLTFPDPYPMWDKFIKNGAKATAELKVQFWGGVYGAARDPMGLEWSLDATKEKEKSNFAGVTPYIMSSDCERHIGWIQKVFEAGIEEIFRSEAKKIMHCHLSCNGGQLYICDPACGPKEEEKAMEGNCEGVVLHMCVPDPDSVWKRAFLNDAQQVIELKQQFWGGYYGCFRDPFGVKWAVIKACGGQ